MEALSVSDQTGLPDKGNGGVSDGNQFEIIFSIAACRNSEPIHLKSPIQSLVILEVNQSVQKFVKWVQVENKIKLIINSISFRCHVATRCQMPSNLHINYMSYITLHNSVKSPIGLQSLNGNKESSDFFNFIHFY